MALNLKQLKTLLHDPPVKVHEAVTVIVDEPEPPPEIDSRKLSVIIAEGKQTEYFPFEDLKELKDTAAEMNEYFKTATYKPNKVDYKKMVEGALEGIQKYWSDKKYVISRVIDLKTIKEKYCE